LNKPVLCAAVALAVMGMPTLAHATYPGANGDVTFVDSESDRGDAGFTDLIRLSPRGKTLGSIVRCAYDQGEGPAKGCASSGASFSRDGKRVAFAIDDRLAVGAADGSSRGVLPKQTDQDGEPAWTPGGSLVFTGRDHGKSNVYLVNADGAALRQLTRNGGAAPACSVSGLIAYARGGYVYVVKPDGSGGRRFARGTNPDFSPSGKTIVLQRRGRLYSKRVRVGGRQRLVARKGSDPVYSPTGTRVLYIQPARENTDLLSTVSPRGKGRHKVYDPHSEPAVEVEGLSSPAWQPRR
jgi:hypothetical protein